MSNDRDAPLAGTVTAVNRATGATLDAGDITTAVLTVNLRKRSILAMDVEEAAHQAGANDGGVLLEFTFQPVFYKDGADHPDAAGEPPQRWQLAMTRVS
jgi:multidrug efflux pump subunit AcrA (membrane-fusion protein)